MTPAVSFEFPAIKNGTVLRVSEAISWADNTAVQLPYITREPNHWYGQASLGPHQAQREVLSCTT